MLLGLGNVRFLKLVLNLNLKLQTSDTVTVSCMSYVCSLTSDMWRLRKTYTYLITYIKW